METLINEFASLGVIGIIGGILLKKYLEDSKEDRKIQQEERKEDRQMYRETIKNFSDKLDKFANVIEINNDRLEVIESDIKTIKSKVGE